MMEKAGKWLHVPVVGFMGIAAVYWVMSTPYAEIDSVDKGLVLIALFLAAFLFESRYMPYVGLMPSIVLLFALGEPEWQTMPVLLKLYIEAGLFIVLLTYVICHIKKARYRVRLNQASYMLYSLKTVFPIYLSGYMLGSYSDPFFAYSFVFLFLATWLFYLKDGI